MMITHRSMIRISVNVFDGLGAPEYLPVMSIYQCDLHPWWAIYKFRGQWDPRWAWLSLYWEGGYHSWWCFSSLTSSLLSLEKEKSDLSYCYYNPFVVFPLLLLQQQHHHHPHHYAAHHLPSLRLLLSFFFSSHLHLTIVAFLFL